METDQGKTVDTALDTTPVKVDSYVVTDDFFGKPWIDVDEWREKPVPHHHVHGGFEGTDTRFTFYFRPAELYRGRMFTPLEGANGGHEDSFGNEHGNLLGGLEMITRLGGYMMESNMGHLGDVFDPKADQDHTIYGFRAAGESGRFSKFVAAQIYGQPPHHSYVWGGSGGGRRSPGCLEYCPDVWDGALPFMGGNETERHGEFRKIKGGGNAFSSMFNVQRLLGDKLVDLVDAVSPGGSGDPFAGLDTSQREELANLYRIGFPRGDEWVIGQPSGVIWQWASMADRFLVEDDYYEKFWTTPGYVGHERDLIDVRATVSRVLSAQDIVDDPAFDAPEYQALRGRVQITAEAKATYGTPLVIEVKDVPPGYRLGTGVRITTGQAVGRQLYCLLAVGDYYLRDAMGEASNLRFSGVLAGDELHIDNHAFLAFCYYYRHHIHDWVEYEFLRVDGKPIYPQCEIPEMSPLMGTLHTGKFPGKLMWVHHTHDASLWPSQGVGMKNNVERERGVEGAKEHFRLRWLENAEHVPPEFAPSDPHRANNTWLIQYGPMVEQSLADLIAWVEHGVEPASTAFEYQDGKVALPTSARSGAASRRWCR
jgi:hypothetical protein